MELTPDNSPPLNADWSNRRAYDNPAFTSPVSSDLESTFSRDDSSPNRVVQLSPRNWNAQKHSPQTELTANRDQGVNSVVLQATTLPENAYRRVLGRRDRNAIRDTVAIGSTHDQPLSLVSYTSVQPSQQINDLNYRAIGFKVSKSTEVNMTLNIDSKEAATGLLVNGNSQKTPSTLPETPERETWGKKADFLLSVIGFAVDLGNVWRFPYVCYRNGGGAFLVPYFIMLIFAGLPLFYMELALGQFQRCGMIGVWRNICPMFCGLGYGISFIAVFVGMYYNTVIAWAVFYTISSFRSEVPWARCHNDWNTPNCFSVVDNLNQSGYNQTNTSLSSAEEFFNYRVLETQHSKGIHNLGGIKWELALSLMAVFVIIYFALWKGIKSSGKAVWITATLPYIVLIILLIRGCTLPGALDGIVYYVRPKWHLLLNIEVWIDAAAQIFFSLGPGFGTLLTLSSYNKFHNNCYMDALLTATINCLTSFLAGFVVFSVLGYMSFIQQKSVEKVAIDGPGLVFVVYPEALATLDGSVFWSIIFFLMLITLGLDSSFGGLEAVITGICDEFPRLGKHREIFVGFLMCICFLGGLSTTTYGGQYVITLLDRHGAPISILLICFCEVVAVNWFYGVRQFSADLKKMLGFEPGIFWKVCWVVICPLFLLVLFILSCYAYSGIQLGSYKYPDWAVAIGWLITLTSIICVPIYMGYLFFTLQGTFKQRMFAMIKPDFSRRNNINMTLESKPHERITYNDIKQSTV